MELDYLRPNVRFIYTFFVKGIYKRVLNIFILFYFKCCPVTEEWLM